MAFGISSSSVSSSFLWAPASAFLFLSLFSFIRFCAFLRAATLNFCSEYLFMHSRMSCKLLRLSLPTVIFSSIVLMCLLLARMSLSFSNQLCNLFLSLCYFIFQCQNGHVFPSKYCIFYFLGYWWHSFQIGTLRCINADVVKYAAAA